MLIGGIDEAGYGPKLGPLLVTGVLLKLEGYKETPDLWEVLQGIVTKDIHAPDRLVVFDSKKVYSRSQKSYDSKNPSPGLRRLERTVLSFYYSFKGSLPRNFGEFLLETSDFNLLEAGCCPWAKIAASYPLPLGVDRNALMSYAERLAGELKRVGIRINQIRSVFLPAYLFNQLLPTYENNKQSLTLAQFLKILRMFIASGKTERIKITCGKLSSRKNYIDELSRWFPSYQVTVIEQTSAVSTYRLSNIIDISFLKNADELDFCVALSSMFAKYTREIFLHGFNEYFRRFVPNLRPTAGYPRDAKRFCRETSSLRERLKIPLRAFWRDK